MAATRAEATRARRWSAALRWFGAEFLVVVTGVLVALALGAWWQERADRAREAAYLHQLAADLETTERALLSISEFHLDAALASARVSQAFWKPSPPTLESLLDDLGTPFRSRRERPVMGTIDALIATGDLRLVRSDSLRAELVAYAEFSEATVENIQRHDETYYRSGVNALVESLDTGYLIHEAERLTPPAEDRSYALSPLPAGERRPPFPVTLEALLADRKLYDAYRKLLVAHRNQGFNYMQILERARRLRGEVHRELHGTLDPGNCQLTGRDGRFSGSCGRALSEERALRLELSEAEGVLTGAWRRDRPPFRVFTGRSNLGPNEMGSEVRVETDIRGRGLIRTAAGWFTVSGLIPPTDGDRLSFRIHADGEVTRDATNGPASRMDGDGEGREPVWDRPRENE